MKVVKLVCLNCESSFDRLAKEHNRQLRLGRIQTFCNRKCCTSYVNRNRIDEFSPFRLFLKRAKKMHVKFGLDFDLTLESLKSQWNLQQGICPYTKIKMDISVTSGNKSFLPHSASLDRIDSNKGYTVDNVEFICLFINYGKNTFSKESVRQFLNKI